MVIGRRHFHTVHADQVQRREFFQKRHQLRTGQAAGLGCAGAWGKGRVQAVDVQRQVTGRVAYAGLDCVQDRRQLLAVLTAQRACRVNQATLIRDILTRRTLAAGANAYLHGFRAVYQALLKSFIGPGAVARWLIKVRTPGVAMGIKMDQCHRSVLSMQGAQQRQGHRVITAYKHTVVSRHQAGCLLLNGGAHLGQGRGIGQTHITRISQVAQRADIEQGVNAIAQHQRGTANFLRPKARAGAVGDRAVEGNSA